VNYQPIADTTQLQILEGLARMFLHGVLIAVALAAVIILCLCLSELRLSGRRAPEVEEVEWSTNGNRACAPRHGESLYSLTPVRLRDTEIERPVEAAREPTTRSVGLGQSEPGQRWSEPVEAR